MFLIKRRWLATAGLLAALLLAVPAPSLAAGQRGGPAAELSGLAARAWAWLERLARVPVAVWEKQGPMIDPNGVAYTVELEESGLVAGQPANRPAGPQ